MTAPTDDPITQRAYSTRQIAAMLDVGYEQARMLIVRGELAHFRVGRHIRVADTEFERYLNTATRGAA
jgi:excisionase family DNA binding protein